MALQPEDLLKNRYRIVRVLGHGGMSAVYLAVDERLGVPCAVKENLTLSPDSERLFRREATLLATLRHPNLPRVTNHFMLEDKQYLVMDYVEGEDLKERLHRLGPLPFNDVLNWSTQVCNALSYLHALNPPIIHRDIKPANIKLTPNHEAMLVDFGIAKAVTPGQMTTNTVALTPGFAPPEQYGIGSTDARADQYALAATLYMLLTGNVPPDSVERLIGNAKLPPVAELRPDVPEHAIHALERALNVQADERFINIREFKRALFNQPLDDSLAAIPTVLASGTRVIPPPPTTPPPLPAQPTQRAYAPATVQLPLTDPPKPPAPPPVATAPVSTPPTARRPWALLLGLGGLGLALLVGAGLFATGALPIFQPSPTPTASLTPTPLPTATLPPPTETIPLPTATTPSTLTPTTTPPPPTSTPEPTFTPIPSPTLSPTPAGTPIGSGGRLAFISNRDGQFFQIYTMNVDGSDVQQLTTDPVDKWSPDWDYTGTQLAWSQDGQQLIYVAEGVEGLDLWVINADGTGAQNLTNARGDDFQPVFCGRGALWFASNRIGDGNTDQVFYFNSIADALAGRRPTNFSSTHNNTNDADPAPYANCQRALFVSTLDGALEIWRYWLDCPGCHRKVRSLKAERGVTDEPALSPDNQFLLYTRRLNDTNEILRVDPDVQITNPDAKQLTSTLDNFSAQWSPDGEWIVFVSNRDGNREVYVMTRDGVGQTNLTNDAAVDTDPVWQPHP